MKSRSERFAPACSAGLQSCLRRRACRPKVSAGRALLPLLLVLALCVGCRGAGSPILVLISFDGWRWDYIDRAKVPNLQTLAARGVRAEGLIPSFPSNTFPSHYTLVTGLYPEHHGIVSNSMVDPVIGERFSMSADTANDPRWWGGEPLWATAIRQGRRAASMFWPGSEAPIGGVRPTYWRPFDDAVPNAERVRQVLEWLALPADERPSFITVYFSDVDSAGHDFGPESTEVLDAASRLDQALGDLIAGIETLQLLETTSVIVVSDHGMSQLDEDRIILLDDYLDLSTVDVIDWTPTLGLALRSGSVDAVYQSLKGKHPALAVYKREDTPWHLHYSRHPRIPPIVGLADEGWRITSRERLASERAAGRKPGGAHGYDPAYKSMHGLFVAAGPRLRRGAVLPAFESVNVYELMCWLLGLEPARNDGDRDATREFLVP